MLMFSLYIMCFTYNLLYCYLFCKNVLKKDFHITKKLVLTSGIFAIFGCLNFYYNKTPLKPFVSHLIYLIVFKVYYKESWGKTLVGLLISFITVSISEIIFGILFVQVGGFDIKFFNNGIIGILIGNFQIMLIALFISNLKKFKDIFGNIVLNINENRKILLSFFLILSLSIVTFIAYNNGYNEGPLSYVILINLFFISVYVFMIGFFVEKSSNDNLISKYDQLHEYSKTYEQELVKRSKRQHEYENQLIIIRSMIEENEDNAVEYINRILKSDEKKNDIKWLTKLTYIPYGGLKGLLYFKLNEMMNKKLNVYLEVSEDLKKKSLWKTYEEDAQDISRIIGVYLDNAIEAASISEEKTIEIQFYLENKNIVFCLGNTFKGKIEESKLDNEGYSSKGKNRGYGLPLVKDLLLKHEELKDERVIVDQYYVQKLIIKPKRK